VNNIESEPHELEPETASNLASNPTCAEVAVPLHVFQTFTYRLAPALSADAEVGARITVPLGRKLVTGYIVALHNTLPDNLAEFDIKDARDLVDTEPVCSPEILDLARWVADYYACPIGEVIKAALPPGMSPSSKRGPSFIKPKLRRFVRLKETSEEQKLTETQQRVIATLDQNSPMALQSLLATAGVGASTVSSLEKKGRVEIYDAAVRRDPLAHASHLQAEEYTLTPAQHSVLEDIEQHRLALFDKLGGFAEKFGRPRRRHVRHAVRARPASRRSNERRMTSRRRRMPHGHGRRS